MVVKFTNTSYENFDRQNITDLLSYTGNETITRLANSKKSKNYILVVGNIHKSQWTQDNPGGYHWLKIQGYDDNKLIKKLKAVHLYMCFYKYSVDKFGNVSIIPCIIPENYPETDVAKVDLSTGYWNMIGISYKPVKRKQ